MKDVRIVVSHIKVETEKVPDGLLLKQLRERLAEKENAQVKVKVKKGVVTIQGTVQQDVDRERVLSTVAGTSGVIGMKDHLKVVAD
jgi:osmotically-inducible protein OsmY